MTMNKIIRVFILLSCIGAPLESNSQYWIQSGGSATIDEGLAICADNNDNVYTTGYFTSAFAMNGLQLNSQGFEDIFICKMNSAGAISWLIRAGGTSQERALSIDANDSGNIVIAGYFYGSTTFGTTQLTSQGQQDIFIAKYDSSGTLLWARQAGGTNSDLGNSVKFDNAGNVIVTGEFSGSCSFGTTTIVSQAGSIDAFIAKFDSNGNLVWAKKGSGQYIDRGTGIAIDLQDNIYVSGMFSDTISFDVLHPNTMMNSAFIIKLNSAGNEQWFRWFGSGTSINSGGVNYSSNGINITGSFSGSLSFLGSTIPATINPSLTYNIYIGRINVTGNLEFLTSDGSDNEINSTSIATKSNGDLVIGGNFRCRLKDYSSPYGSGIFCSKGFRDNFVASYSNTGNWLWARHFAGKQDDALNSLTIHSDSLIAVTGGYSSDYTVPIKITQMNAYGILGTDYNIQNSPLTFCNDNSYNEYAIYESKGNSDVFIHSAVNLLREPLDCFNRVAGACIRNYRNLCVVGSTSVCEDTIITCTIASLDIRPGLNSINAYNYFLAPEFNYNWNNGANTGFITVATTGTYSASATTIDGCFVHTDSTYLIGSYQSQPAISDNKGFNISSPSPSPIFLCAPDSVILTCTNVGSSVVSWSGFANGMNPVSVNSSGPYYCTLTNSYGCTSTTLVIVDITNPISTIIQPEIICLDDSDENDSISVCTNQIFEFYIFDEISNPGGTVVQCIPELSFINVTVDSLSSALVYEGINECNNLINTFFSPVPGIYNLIITAQIIRNNPCGSDTSYVTKNMYVEVLPATIGSLVFTVTGPSEICPGDTAMIIAAPPQNSYSWSNGSTNDTIYVTQPGLYNVDGELITTNPFGCDDRYTGTASHIVNFFAQPNITLNPSTGIICPNDSILLECSGSSIIDWFGPSGNITTGTNNIYTSVPGNYFCIQTVEPGCVLLSNTVSLSQNSSPSLQAYPPTFCISDSTSLSVLASPGSVIQWQPPLSGSSPNQVVLNAGTYFCDVTSCGVTSSLSVTVNNFTSISAPTISFTPPVLTSSLAQGYQWYVNGFPLPSANNQTHTPTVPGAYTVMVTDSNGCTALSDPFVITSLLENNLESYIHFSPNPATTFIQLSISNSEVNLKDAIVTIRNIHGQLLRNEPLSGDLKININGITNGIYFFEMVSKNILYKKKFVIQN